MAPSVSINLAWFLEVSGPEDVACVLRSHLYLLTRGIPEGPSFPLHEWKHTFAAEWFVGQLLTWRVCIVL